MKKIIVLVCLAVSLFAGELQDAIKSYVGPTKYETQKNLINVLFASSNNFMRKDGGVDSVKVIEVLKKNGLITLLYDKPVQLRLAFRTQNEPMIFLQIVNETLETMGYNYFLTNNALRDQNGFVWEIYLQTEHILDPVAFSNALNAKGCKITRITKNNDNYWFYDIDSRNAVVNAKKIDRGVNTPLGKSLRPYWVEVKGASEVVITPNASDQWFPDVVFFDAALNVLASTKSQEQSKTLKLSVPQNAMYVKIGDSVMLDNIKRGLSMTVK